jgi:hypothetical protein
MKYIVSRYNQSTDWLSNYTDDFIIYDRSEEPMQGEWVIPVPNIGSDIYDKLTYIIDNYDNLPEVAVYTKANLFKYISKEEFDQVKDNTTFTPLLTQHHKEVLCDFGMPNPGAPFSFYKDGMYYELNYPSYLKQHRTKDLYFCFANTFQDHPLFSLLGIKGMEYLPFAPGSNYIIPKGNILQHPKFFYEELRSHLGWDRYPGEAMIIERGLYTVFSSKS